MFSKKQIQQFKEIYFEKFGEKISDQKALELATSLINLYKTVYKSNKKII